jgi:Predicted dithiol-disulfide isomerase involved in polyketide biosynthesis
MLKRYIALLIIAMWTTGMAAAQQRTIQTAKQRTTMQKMKVEIWSDIMCPFCYIGKRHFEEAMGSFADSNNVEIVWKSFQLDPTIPQSFDKAPSVYQYLADKKGFSYEQSVQMHDRVIQMAKDAGLQYNFDIAVVANSFNAHRMIQLAKTKGLGDEAEERLFLAYFTQGKNFGSPEVLVELGKEIGLTEADVKEALSNEAYANKVRQDVQEAQSIGVTGVPFFVFDRKYAISGAQPTQAFVQTLEKSFGEWRAANPAIELQVSDGPACTPDGECK